MVDTAIGREGFLSHSVIGPLEKIYQFQISQQITTNLTTINDTNKQKTTNLPTIKLSQSNIKEKLQIYQ